MTETGYRIQGATGEWEVVIGLEVHAQVTSQRQALLRRVDRVRRRAQQRRSRWSTRRCPGMLPVPNRECIRQAVRTGMAIEAQINPWSRFDRKNYFYADLPQGYQISQLYHPIVGEGAIEIELDEKDPGRDQDDRHRAHPCRAGRGQADARPAPDHLLCRSQPLGRGADGDRLAARHALARGGRAPMSASCARSCAMSAAATATWRRARCAPTSTSRCASRASALGTRTETKNVNSVRFVMAVIEHEARRQVDLIEDGGTIVQETRLFDPDNGETRSLRSQGRRARLSLLPRSRSAAARTRRRVPRRMPREPARAARRQARAATRTSSACPPTMPRVLTAEVETARWFEALLLRREARASPRPKSPSRRANWLISELFGALNRLGKSIEDSPVTPGAGAPNCCALIADGTISGTLAKQVFEIMLETGDGSRRDRRGARASSRPATPARSRR